MYKIGNLNIDILYIQKNQFPSRLVPFYIAEAPPDITYDF